MIISGMGIDAAMDEFMRAQRVGQDGEGRLPEECRRRVPLSLGAGGRRYYGRAAREEKT